MSRTKKQRLLERIKNKEFIISVQMDPPRTSDLTQFTHVLRELKKVGVTTVDINSSRITVDRIPHDSIHLACAIQRRGFETIPHVTTRDSSISALASQIHSAYTWDDVRNFLIITGDPNETHKALIPSEGVFQTDSVGAVHLLHEHVRTKTGVAPHIVLGAAVNQNEPDREKEIMRLKEKESAGADFFMSQPVFTTQQADELFSLFHEHSSKPLIVGIWPLITPRIIEYIYFNGAVGVTLPPEVYKETLLYYEDAIGLQILGMQRAYALIEYIKKSGKAQGIYLVAPSRNPLLIFDLITKLHRE